MEEARSPSQSNTADILVWAFGVARMEDEMEGSITTECHITLGPFVNLCHFLHTKGSTSHLHKHTLQWAPLPLGSPCAKLYNTIRQILDTLQWVHVQGTLPAWPWTGPTQPFQAHILHRTIPPPSGSHTSQPPTSCPSHSHIHTIHFVPPNTPSQSINPPPNKPHQLFNKHSLTSTQYSPLHRPSNHILRIPSVSNPPESTSPPLPTFMHALSFTPTLSQSPDEQTLLAVAQGARRPAQTSSQTFQFFFFFILYCCSRQCSLSHPNPATPVLTENSFSRSPVHKIKKQTTNAIIKTQFSFFWFSPFPFKSCTAANVIPASATVPPSPFFPYSLWGFLFFVFLPPFFLPPHYPSPYFLFSYPLQAGNSLYPRVTFFFSYWTAAVLLCFANFFLFLSLSVWKGNFLFVLFLREVSSSWHNLGRPIYRPL